MPEYWYMRQKAQGFCVRCGQPAEDRTLLEEKHGTD